MQINIRISFLLTISMAALIDMVEGEKLSVLDLGCGNGAQTKELADRGHDVMGHSALYEQFRNRDMDYVMPFYFPTIGEYASLLEQGGFLVKSALLFDRPTRLEGEKGLYDWIHMFIKTPFAGTDASLQEEIIGSAAAALKDTLFHDGKWYADYVRLRCRAVKC